MPGLRGGAGAANGRRPSRCAGGGGVVSVVRTLCPSCVRTRVQIAEDAPRWPGDPGQREISTRRVQDGVVHEMADLGVKTQCGLDLREPWVWTDDPITCGACKAAEARAEAAAEAQAAAELAEGAPDAR